MRRKIKVLNIVSTIDDGGLEILVYRIYKSLDREKYDLNICSLTIPPDKFITQGFKKICSNWLFLNFKNKNVGIFDFIRNIHFTFKLARYIAKNKFDIIHSHDFFPAFITRISVIISRLFFYKPKRIFITYHNIYYWLKPLHHFINRVLSLITDNIVCVTKSVKDYAIIREKIKKDKFVVIYNGLNSAEFFPDRNLRDSQRKILGYAENDFVLCNVGVYSVRKGQIYLLNAFKNLLVNQKNLKLALVGSIRDHELNVYEEMVNFVKENNLGEYVKFVDTIKEVNKIYNMLDLFVMCSITEGFGLAAYEAMLAEKLCIFSDIAPFKELIEDSVNGFIFENKNVESLTKVLKYVISNYDELGNIRKKGREFVKTKLSEEEMVFKYNSLYNISN